MELISVIVPVYNVEKYLNRCVKSIVEQTYTNLEVLLIDDGSTDRCAVLCEEWAAKDGRIKAIHQKNSGVSTARNTGLKNATGEYILMVDSDDYLNNEMIEILYDLLQSRGADLAICDFEKGADKTYAFSLCDETTDEIINNRVALKRIYESNDSALRYVAPWGKLYKRKLFDGIRYPEGKIFEDIYVTHQILYRCNKVVVVPQKMVYYFQRPDSIMNTNFHIGKLDYLGALKERIAFFQNHGLDDLAEIAYDEYLHALIWEYSRAHDLLGNRAAMYDIKTRFRSAYKKGYMSKRYPKENAAFLTAFNINPELIIVYWRLSGKWNKLLKRK